MLEFMRRKARSTTIQIIIVIIILVFVFWGVGSNQGGSPDSVATVNGENISYQQYQQTYEQIVSGYREQLGGNLPPGLLEALNLKEQVLTQIIRQRLLRQGAAQAGLLAGSDEVRKAIQEMEAFRENGIFQLDRYKTMLSSARMTPAEFEESIRADLSNSKTLLHLSRFARVTDSELAMRFAFDNDEISLEYATFSPAAFRDKVTVSNEDLHDFHQSRKIAYRTEPQIRLQYLSFLHRQDAKPDAEEEGGQGETFQPAGNLAFQMAQQAYEGIITAGSLQKYAAESKTPLRETGYFPPANPPAELARQPALVNAAFSLQKGELSSLLETEEGFTILSVDDVKEPQLLPLEEIRAVVEKDFIAEQALELAREAATKLRQQTAEKGGSLADEAVASGGTAQQTGFFSRRAPAASGLPGEVAAQGLKLSAAAPVPKTVAESGDTFYVLRFRESRAADDQGFAAEKELLREALLAEKQARILDAWLAYLQSRARITTSKTAF
jgi:peptidyl-prolyl cis-trans isomerase D